MRASPLALALALTLCRPLLAPLALRVPFALPQLERAEAKYRRALATVKAVRTLAFVHVHARMRLHSS